MLMPHAQQDPRPAPHSQDELQLQRRVSPASQGPQQHGESQPDHDIAAAAAAAPPPPPPPPPPEPAHDDELALPAKKKQKRNKPTLSCEDCVERKTKCDRGRPKCLACVKRQSACRYSEVANLIASTNSSSRHVVRPKKKKDSSSAPLAVDGPGIGIKIVPPHPPTPRTQHRSVSLSSNSSSPFLLSNIPYSVHSASPFFGLGSEHPFANYWTSRGGIGEVIGVLPSKDQADLLVAKYFDAVDPVYPMIHRRNFFADYERFWSLPTVEKQMADPVLIALHFVVYAMGTQFISTRTNHEQAQIAEFYVSASQQALRLSSYLSKVSIRTLQAMILICYFLMNDNHASDAWAFGGVLMRQSYAMGLHRDPDIIAARCSLSDRQQRRKVWQAVFFQDTFLTVLLKLPPTATFCDVRVESLTDDLDVVPNGTDASANPMSITSIASVADAFPPYEFEDRQYIKYMWYLAKLVQSTVCNPRSLGTPIADSPAAKAKLVQDYHTLLSSFPASLITSDDAGIAALATENPRRLRQNLFLRSNYWHCVMVIQADESADVGTSCDIRGALEAARMALRAFFQFEVHLRVDAGVWWVFQHRAFEEALLTARILAAQPVPASTTAPSTPPRPPPSPATSPTSHSTTPKSDLHPLQESHHTVHPKHDTLFQAAKADAQRTLEILDTVSPPDLQKTRTEVLRGALADVLW